MEHEPRGLLGDIQVAGDFVAANPIFAIDYEPHGHKPLIERERTVLEDRTNLDRELPPIVFLAAFPESPCFQEADFFGAASRTANTVRPTGSHQQRQCAVTVGEITNRFDQGVGPRDLFHESKS